MCIRDSVIAATEADAELWELLALMGGWPEWSIEEPEDEKKKKKKKPSISERGIEQRTIEQR